LEIWGWGLREEDGWINKQECGERDGGKESERDFQDGRRQFLENWKFFPSLILSLTFWKKLYSYFLDLEMPQIKLI
jgi:hypothetical protein